MRKRGIKLGRDHFAVRALTWKAAAFIDYTAQLKTDSLLITDLDAFENGTTTASLPPLHRCGRAAPAATSQRNRC